MINYKLYQQEIGEGKKIMPFMDLPEGMTEVNLKEEGYKLVYEGIIEGETVGEKLNKLFHKFNMKHPTFYNGRSMSVGDIVYLPVEGEYYYCMCIGWERINIIK